MIILIYGVFPQELVQNAIFWINKNIYIFDELGAEYAGLDKDFFFTGKNEKYKILCMLDYKVEIIVLIMT